MWGTTEGMRLSAERDELYAALRKVEPLLGDRPERRLLRVDVDDRLNLSTTDRDQLITAGVRADIVSKGTAVGYGRFLIEFVRRAPDGRVVLWSEDGELFAEDGGSKTKLATFEDDLWPQIGHVDGDPVVWESHALKQLSRVLHAVSKDDARPILQGIGFAGGWAAATDSYRLAAARVELPRHVQVVIPGSAVENALRLAEGRDMTVRFSQNQVSFYVADATVTCSLLAGDFPDWRSVIPETGSKEVRADRQELLNALERLSYLAQRDDRSCIQIHPEPEGLRIDARLADIGYQEDRIPGENTVGDVSLQFHHLKDLLGQLTLATVTLEMAGSLAPAVVREEGFIGLLMPIRQ